MKIALLRPNKKNRAQAVLEFTLVLPILLLLLYGMIEVGRLIFVFASVANASRQAARYGSASGDINNVAFYQDCDGIRTVANQSAYIIKFEDVKITYDRGLYPDGTQIPIAGIDPDPSVDSCPVEYDTIRNGDRIIVQVSAIYEPIVSIVPIEPIKIVSASARSFLISIPIFGSALPTGFAAESSTPSRIPTSPNQITDTPTIAWTATFTHIPSSGQINTPDPRFSPTNTRPATVTFTPSSTPFPTYTPSITPTQISCSGLTGVSHGPLVFIDNIMEMIINNQTGYTLSTSQIYLEWNHDRGHGSGGDSDLRLRQIMFAGQVWNGDIKTPSAYIPAFYPSIPPGESKIQFIFHQSYDRTDGTERIIISIGTPGCINYPIDSSN